MADKRVRGRVGRRVRARRVTAVAVSAATALALAGCGGMGGSGRSAGVLTIADDSQPLSGLDPIMAQAFNAKRLVAQFYEGLLALGPDNKTIQPAIAESYEQISPTEYEFTLRKGVTFHDGEPVKPSDVVFSLKRIVDPDQHSPYVSLYGFKEVKALGDDKVGVTLKRPQSSFLRLVAQPWSAGIVSEKWIKSRTVNDLKTQENGTGPYKLDRYQEGSLIETSRFDGYWDRGKPKIAEVDYRLMPDEATRVQALRTGSVDMTQIKLPRNVEALKRHGVQVGPEYNIGSYWIGLNMKQGPLRNAKVRQAISRALDRRQLIKIGSQGAGELAGVVPPADPLGSPAAADFPNYRFDLAGAKRLMAESGESDVRLTMVLQSEIAEIMATAQLMKEQLAQIGVTLDIRQLPFGQLVGNLLSGDWKADMIQLTAALNADAGQYLALWLDKGIPATRHSDAELWRMMDEAVHKATTDEERKRRYAEINRYIAEKVYMLVPYAAPIAYDVWSPEVENFRADLSGTRILLKNAG